jgi:hypothetical protein
MQSTHPFVDLGMEVHLHIRDNAYTCVAVGKSYAIMNWTLLVSFRCAALRATIIIPFLISPRLYWNKGGFRLPFRTAQHAQRARSNCIFP